VAWAYRTGTFATTVSSSFSSAGLTLGLGAAVQAGDRIVVFVFNSSGGAQTHTVTDNLNAGSYTQDVSLLNGGNNNKWMIFSKANSLAGTPTVKVAVTSGTGGFCVAAYSGTSTTDGATDGTAGAFTPSATPTSGATAATTAANELVVGGYGDFGWSKTISAGSGFTLRGKFQGGGSYEGAIEDKDSGASGGTQTATFSLDSAPPTCGVVCVVYKVAITTVNYPITVTATQSTTALSPGRAVRQTRSMSQAQTVALQRTFVPGSITYPLTVTASQPTQVSLGRRLALRLPTIGVGQVVSLASGLLGKTAKVFVVDGRRLEFAVSRRGIRFTVEER